MNAADFMQLSDSATNHFLTGCGVGYEDLPLPVRRQVKHLNESISRASASNDVAWDLAINDRGAALDRAEAKQTSERQRLSAERMKVLKTGYAAVLQRRGAFSC